LWQTFFAVGVLIAVWATFGGTALPVASPSQADKERVIGSAAPLVDAIRSYEKAHTNPPQNLEVLVPSYLKSLPRPPGDLCVGDYLYAAEGTQWRLAVCIRGKANRVLTYSSRLDYPSGKRSAPVERVGTWAYFENDPY